MNGIEKKIVKQSTTGQQLILCENLGYHKYVQDVLVERVNELLEKEQISQPFNEDTLSERMNRDYGETGTKS